MSSAARYYQRAPRYVFRPNDKSIMRFAGMDSRGLSSHANVNDLSATGLSFLVDGPIIPMEGDLLKIEFGVPGRKQIAWFATVVRVESRTDWNPELGDRSRTLVAIRFRQLPVPFQKAIQKSISGRLSGDEEPGGIDLRTQTASLMALGGFSVAMLGAFCLMVQTMPSWHVIHPWLKLFF